MRSMHIDPVRAKIPQCPRKHRFFIKAVICPLPKLAFDAKAQQKHLYQFFKLADGGAGQERNFDFLFCFGRQRLFDFHALTEQLGSVERVDEE